MVASLLGSCQEFVEIDPPTTEITEQSVFNENSTARSAMAGLYSKLMENEYNFTSGINSITTLSGLSADEFVNSSTNSSGTPFYNNSLTGNETGTMWSNLYKTIYMSNAILEGVQGSTQLSTETSNQIQGEALFIRAWCHFYLVNLFGDVPVVRSTDYRINNAISRSSKEEVYVRIIEDLKLAQTLLPKDYTVTNGERTTPTFWAATSLLSRAYLYTGEWAMAESAASQVISHNEFNLESLNNVFLNSSKEAIWQLKPVFPGVNTYDGATYILTTSPKVVSLAVAVSNDFEAGDLRTTNWIKAISVNGNTFYFPNKYKVKSGSAVSEYLMVFRLAEQYLIRAEARANLNKLTEAVEDINVIRQRAGLGVTSAISQGDILKSVEQERRAELFCEWGHRWLDLKRTERINVVLGTYKSNWQETDSLFPLPITELNKNPNLLPQNPGY